ncbi:serine protease [Iningainema tapete]|uniref:Tetratricopeptide repeat protein n=1 Tax=Iningainema tapete BLCC-T55 TaxID=2748662 RepID=A0A8J7C8Z2_9CYAN|nr:serine protease [Iningainema tapete]MBD2777434.1 tetratricopeptide repeat protein [Iningainema tapete BLCC-T55]
MNRYRFNQMALASLSSLLFFPSALAGTFIQSNHPTSVLVSSRLSEAEIRQLAQAITVRVLSAHQGGSGILIKKQGQTYTILTNAHVVNSKAAYRIQTPDGKNHPAVVISRGDSLKGNDLALSQFNAKENYRVVPLATNSNLSENQEVFAAGFPYDRKELVISSGKISLLSSQPLVGGYQIGYTNEIQQGMSGGPLLNLEGKLIGVNGLLNRAILNDAYVYQNGSRPSTEQLQHLRQLSFAVPIQTLAKIAPNQANGRTKEQNQQQASQQPVANNILDKVNSIAEQITVRIDSKNNGNGSGVIIAHTGQTYYVVTALHVVKNPDSYEIVTLDGQRYALQQQNIIKPEGLDVALLKFTSNQTYSVATIAKYNLFKLSTNNWVFLSGFPGNANGKRKFTAGYLQGKEKVFTRAKDDDNFDRLINYGYELIYSNLTLAGMSGGPVLDSKGQVIGINAGSEDESVNSQVNLGFGLGVPSSTLLGLATRAGLKPGLLKRVNTAPEKLTEVEINSLQNHRLFAVEKLQQNANEFDWLNYGNQLWRLGKNSEAIAALLQAIKLKPDFPQAYYVQGLALYSQKKYPEALAAVEQAIKSNPDYFEAGIFKREVLQKLEKYPEALAAIDKAIEYNNNDVNLYLQRGWTLYWLKRYSAAMQAFKKAIDFKPNSLGYLSRGVLRTNLKDYQGGIADLNEAIRLQPDYARLYSNRGRARSMLKDLKGAISDYDQAIQLAPDDADGYYNRGRVRYIFLRDFKGALADYNPAIQIAPDDVSSYIGRGLVRSDLRDLKGALADFNQAIQLEPNTALSYKIRGDFHKKLKDYKEALSDYNQAIQLQPNWAVAYASRGLVRFFLNDPKGAIADLDRAIKFPSDYISPGSFSSAVYQYRGSVHEKLKDYQAALADYTKMIQLEPDEAFAYSLRGDIRTKLKDQEGASSDYLKAIELYSKEIELVPGNAMTYLWRGLIRNKLEDYRLALSDYNQAIIIEPDNAVAYLSRGLVRNQLKDYQGAITDYSQWIKLQPNNALGYSLRGDVRQRSIRTAWS